MSPGGRRESRGFFAMDYDQIVKSHEQFVIIAPIQDMYAKIMDDKHTRSDEMTKEERYQYNINLQVNPQIAKHIEMMKQGKQVRQVVAYEYY